MRIRKNILPRRLVDVLCFLLIAVFLPIIFLFEMTVVLPALHTPGGFFHTFTFGIAIFLIFNIKCNMIACMMVDTSVDYKRLQTTLDDADRTDWRHCEICKRDAPPRSWHCKTCESCILKRDHHCLFTGCCIGHNNHRYFMMFIIYLFIGSTYALVYNSIFLWVLNGHVFWNVLSLLKMVCPLLMCLSGSPWNNMYLVFYNLNILAVAYSVLLVAYHWPTVIRGGVCAERCQNYPYDLGWRQNLANVFGKRMHLVWLSPFVNSPLPNDGTHWTRSISTSPHLNHHDHQQRSESKRRRNHVR